MKITLGLHLDGQRSWRRRNIFGHATVGPMGLLNLLEIFLGLPKPIENEAERILQYKDLLANLDTSDRFYHRSFEADQYAVARTLLGWRDKWYLHGWEGSFVQSVPQRLSDMAEIEKQVPGKLAPSIGERLSAIAQALDQRKHPIESVELNDPLSDFPIKWQAVLQKLPLKQFASPALVNGTNNLSRLQQKLMHPEGDRISWGIDDSLIVFRSHSRIAAAGLVADLSNHNPDETLLVAETEGALYDTLSSAYGNARLGISEKSELRPPLQLLFIAFALIWKPLDVYALLEFLAHPMSPLPRYASSILAEAVAAQPGIGGEKWQDALKKIQESAADKAENVMEIIHEWLQQPAIPASDPAPISLLEEIAGRVAKSFRSRLGTEEYYTQRAQHSGNSQCVQIATALRLLRNQGVQNITRLELNQLFDQTAGNGESSADSRPEVGSALLATHPAAILDPMDNVIWWNMSAPSLPSSYPWYSHEMKALQDAGVMLPDMSEVLEANARNWLRPIFAARKQLILTLPAEGEEVHPIWLSIERVFEANSIPVQLVEAVLENKLYLAKANAIKHLSLPQRRRWWHLDKGAIPARKRHSFSSLEKFIHNPFEWILRYPAQINPPRILSISDGNMLLGSIAHRCIEQLYSQPGAIDWSPEQAAVWVDNHLQTLLEKEGAVMLLPGRRASLEAFRQKLHAAVNALHRHLQSAQVSLVEPEKELSGNFFMGELYGYIDILATREDGATAVVDMKWGRGKDYREKLQNNRQLQLAIYGELMRQKTGKWAAPAYYILAEGNLYAQDRTYFPEAMVARVKEEGGSAMLWQKALETLRWRHEQIEHGKIELIMDNTEPDENSSWPENALEIEDPSPWASDYGWLAGWKDDT